jgi:hypothetical protein
MYRGKMERALLGLAPAPPRGLPRIWCVLGARGPEALDGRILFP